MSVAKPADTQPEVGTETPDSPGSNPTDWQEETEDNHGLMEKAAEKLGVVQEARVLGGAVITVTLVLIVLNVIMGLDIVANATGPYADVMTDVTSISGAAFSVLVVGFIVVAANAVLNYFGRGL
jgi:hypothetical protein